MSAPLYSGFPWIVGASSGAVVTPIFQGPKGDKGDAGTNGTNGSAAWTLTTGAFVQPDVDSSVTVTVADSTWMGAGETVYVSGGGYYKVVSKPNSTSVILTNVGYSGNGAPGITVASGSMCSPSGPMGTAGASSGVVYGTQAALAATALEGPLIWVLSDSDPPYQQVFIPPA